MFIRDGKEIRTTAVEEPVKLEQLTRHKVDTSGCEHQELLDRARTVLGYRCPSKDGRLALVLAELEIEQLDHKEVRAYMNSKTGNGFEFVRYAIDGPRGYHLPIPVHVLNKAIQIKERLPEA